MIRHGGKIDLIDAKLDIRTVKQVIKLSGAIFFKVNNQPWPFWFQFIGVMIAGGGSIADRVDSKFT